MGDFLHQAQLTNAVTGFATCFAGIMPLLYTFLTKRQPARWMFVYTCIVITGIPTVWFHSFEDSRVLAALDVSSNILLVWAMQIGVALDFMPRWKSVSFVAVMTVVNSCAWAYIAYETTLPTKDYWLAFGGFGGFHMGELSLIANSFLTTGIFFANWRRIPETARPLLLVVFSMFLVGMLLATASNDQVAFRIFAYHSTWHIVGAFALITLWLFNHVRFNESPTGTIEGATA